MKPGIELSVAYSDEHLVELCVVASHGQFSGRANVYAALDTPGALADLLSGFPAKPGDVRNFDLGASAEATSQGSATLRFYCRDSAGHVAVEVQLRTMSDYLDARALRRSTLTWNQHQSIRSLGSFVGCQTLLARKLGLRQRSNSDWSRGRPTRMPPFEASSAAAQSQIVMRLEN
jgi:hypothetical protein